MLAIALALAPGCMVSSPRPLGPGGPIAQGSREADAEMVVEVVAAHNKIRGRRGLSPLTVDPRLEAAAERHASDMARRRKMSHRGGDRSSPFQRMEAAGYLSQRAAENIAAGTFTVDSLMNAWMESPPHRRNILGSYSQLGAAVAADEGGQTYWCVTFGKPFGP